MPFFLLLLFITKQISFRLAYFSNNLSTHIQCFFSCVIAIVETRMNCQSKGRFLRNGQVFNIVPFDLMCSFLVLLLFFLLSCWWYFLVPQRLPNNLSSFNMLHSVSSSFFFLCYFASNFFLYIYNFLHRRSDSIKFLFFTTSVLDVRCVSIFSCIIRSWSLYTFYAFIYIQFFPFDAK